MYGILVDVTRCTGCEKCVVACATAHGQASARPELEPSGEGLSDRHLCSIEALDSGRFARKACMHCVEPSCVAACLVGGITKSPEGPVVYDPDKCIGCRYCMLACPHHVPRYEWTKTTPFMKKCDMCADRLAEGQKPTCVEACPNQALRFGERSELLRVAHQTIAGKPESYVARVWGEHEWGGTSVMYISDVDLSALDWPAETTPPIPALTDPMIEKTPFIGAGAAFGLWALGAIISRRNEVMAAENPTKQGEQDND
jgi:formate dehydrogenase iron-sulfur subunit